jgi:hypothetical protein
MKKLALSLFAVALVTAFSASSLRAEGGCSGCKGDKDKKEEPKKEEPKKN